jgi:molybdopterin/thiamine biosynthesis adenylyltransferase/rhodanese-related sulfurtransferase
MEDLERYHRQIIIPEFGTQGQAKLLASKVLVIGAGGLGCPIIWYLAAAGVGTIGIADFDTVSMSNLHRQILYNQEDIGKLKADIAAKKVQVSYPQVNVISITEEVNQENIEEIISTYDIIVEATDNLSVKYLINDYCFVLKKPLVVGSIYRFEGQIYVFNLPPFTKENRFNYRDIFPEVSQEINCAEAGVLGVLPGVVGTMQATEVIKIITAIGEPLFGKMLVLNLLSNTFLTLDIIHQPKTEKIILENTQRKNTVKEIDEKKLSEIIKKENTIVIDVRESHEQPKLMIENKFEISLNELDKNILFFGNYEHIITICQSGKRSKIAADFIFSKFPDKNIYSLKNGITSIKTKELLSYERT